MPTDPTFKIGDRVFVELTNPGGTTAGAVTRFEGPIVSLTPTQAQVQCPGYLVWLDQAVLKPTNGA